MTVDAFTKSLMRERDEIITKHDALVDRLQAVADVAADLLLLAGHGVRCENSLADYEAAKAALIENLPPFDLPDAEGVLAQR